MREENTEGTSASRVCWEELEQCVRTQVGVIVQRLLEEEVTELLGRVKSERKGMVDPAPGYRNGYGKRRRLALTCGTITVRRPRVRGLDQRFVSRILPLFKRRTEEVAGLLPELYLHGLAQGDFELGRLGVVQPRLDEDAIPPQVNDLEVLQGAKYVDGVRVTRSKKEAAA